MTTTSSPTRIDRADPLARAVRARDGGARPGADARRTPGDRAIVLADGTIEGFVGGQCAAGSVRTAALGALRDRRGRAAAGAARRRATPSPRRPGAQRRGQPVPVRRSVGDLPRAAAARRRCSTSSATSPTAEAVADAGRRRSASSSTGPPRAPARRVRPRRSSSQPRRRRAGRDPGRARRRRRLRRPGRAATPAAQALLDELDLTERRARPGAHPRRARHRRPHRARDRAVDPGRDRARHPARGAAPPPPRGPAGDRRQAVDPVCGMTVTVGPDTPHAGGRRRRPLVLQPGLPRPLPGGPRVGPAS